MLVAYATPLPVRPVLPAYRIKLIVAVGELSELDVLCQRTVKTVSHLKFVGCVGAVDLHRRALCVGKKHGVLERRSLPSGIVYHSAERYVGASTVVYRLLRRHKSLRGDKLHVLT